MFKSITKIWPTNININLNWTKTKLRHCNCLKFIKASGEYLFKSRKPRRARKVRANIKIGDWCDMRWNTFVVFNLPHQRRLWAFLKLNKFTISINQKSFIHINYGACTSRIITYCVRKPAVPYWILQSTFFGYFSCPSKICPWEFGMVIVFLYIRV